MALYYDSTHAAPLEVRVLSLDKQVRIYEAEAQNLLHSFPLADCTLVKNENRLQVHLTEGGKPYLVLSLNEPAAILLENEISDAQAGFLSTLLRKRVHILLGTVLVLVLGIYFFFVAAVPAIGLHLISIKQEQALGNSIYRSVAATKAVDSTASLQAQAFADCLHLSQSYTLRVIVLKNREVNAFALPGGIIVINTGILQQMHTYEELTALLAHEVTHINHRHSLRSILKSLSLSILTSFITGSTSGLSTAIINSAANLKELSYSRGLETEADKTGITLLQENHIAPSGMIALLKDLQAIETNTPVSFLSSHPQTADRIQAAAAIIGKLPSTNYPTRPELDQLWQQLKKVSH